jgi:hypothetical protein
MGSRHHRRWTPREDRDLSMSWGLEALSQLARRLGRTPITIYWRARKLGLRLGAPEGMEYLQHAAARAGYTTGQLRRILRAADVTLRCTPSRPDAKRHGRGLRPFHRFHYVDPIDVDDAVAAWCRQETTEGAARRHGVCGDTIRRLLLAAGHAPPRRRKAHWRVDPELVDRLVTAAMGLASVRAHAFRVGVTRQTLAGWLRAADVLGGKRMGVEVRLPREVVDRVVAERRAAIGCRAPARRAA